MVPVTSAGATRSWCAAVLVHFRGTRRGGHWWSTLAAPVLAGLGLLTGLYLLVSRFGRLAGTVPEGVDPTVTAWRLSATGRMLVLLPFVVFLVGLAWGTALNRRGHRRDAFQAIVG
jgi:hypothetical protein